MERAKAKRETPKRLIEGRNPILEALLAKAVIDQIWVAPGIVKDKKIKQILRLANWRQISVKRTSRKHLDRISETGIHQGVIAFGLALPAVTLKELLEEEKNKERLCVLLLTEVLDEQNLGAILRTAEATGTAAVIIPKRAKGVTSVVTRVAMGAAESLPVVKENLFFAIKILKEDGVKIVGAEAKTGRSLYQTDLRGRTAFVVGGENKGLTAPIKEVCDFLVSIPMEGKVSSLNMSVACAVLLYEKLRQELVKNGS